MRTVRLSTVRDAAAILARADRPPPPLPPPRERRRRRARRRGVAPVVAPSAARAEINVTPLVDVVLVLLIIFMVVTPLLHRGVDLELPLTDHHLTRQDTGEQIVVSVREDGVFLDAVRVPVERLSAALERELRTAPHRPVNVQAARTLHFVEVRKVLEQVHAAGAQQVNLETKERSR